MTSPKFVLFLTCYFLWRTARTTEQRLSSSVRQENGFLSVKAGENMTLHCFYDARASIWLYWYKQTLGQRPRLISSFRLNAKNVTFHDEFKNNPRFKVDIKHEAYHMKISDLHISDTATYYCASGYSLLFTLLDDKTVSVQDPGSNFQTQVHQSASETIQPGGSVTLKCTVHTGTCDGKHSVYWFKNSDESQQKVIYTDGGRNDTQCDTQSQSCVYHLSMKSLNRSDAGTYYCAVTSCGRILFGNGTKLNFKDNVVLMYFLSGALTFTTILSVFLALSVYKMKKNSCHSPESQASFTAPSTRNDEGHRDTNNLHYAALNVTLPNGSRGQRDSTTTECVYSSVKQ